MQDHDINITITFKIRRLSYLLQSHSYERMKSYAQTEGIYDLVLINTIRKILNQHINKYPIFFNDKILADCIYSYTIAKRIDNLNQLLFSK